MTHHLRAPEAMPRWLGASDAARYLGMSPSTLRKLDLPRKRVGALALYERADLDAFADSVPYEGEAAEEANSCDAILAGGGR